MTTTAAPDSQTPLDADPAFDAERLARHLLVCTQQAALACQPWVGHGASDGADGAATAAMRGAFDAVPGRGTIVIGEGEKDDAPMLYLGEDVGTGQGPAFDVAVDPLENTTACSRALEGAIAVVAAAPGGALWSSPGWYMDKIVVGQRAAGTVDITRPLTDNLRAVAEALDKPVGDLRAVVLDKPRHSQLVEDLYEVGVAVELIPDGDVAGSLKVVLPDARADLLLGVGGSPEGVITACAVRVLGGDMQAALAPQSEDERARLIEAGQEPGAPMSLDDLVDSDECCFVSTGVTRSELLDAPRHTPEGWRTQTFLSTPRHPRQLVEAVHRPGEDSHVIDLRNPDA